MTDKYRHDSRIGYVQTRDYPYESIPHTPVSEWRDADIQNASASLEQEMRNRMASCLENAGIPAFATCEVVGHTVMFSLVCVQPPDDADGEWPDDVEPVYATVEECQRLLDTVRNLHPVEAYRRWFDKLEVWPALPYTDAQRQQDYRDERERLDRELHDGSITAEDYAISRQNARDFYRS